MQSQAVKQKRDNDTPHKGVREHWDFRVPVHCPFGTLVKRNDRARRDYWGFSGGLGGLGPRDLTGICLSN